MYIEAWEKRLKRKLTDQKKRGYPMDKSDASGTLVGVVDDSSAACDSRPMLLIQLPNSLDSNKTKWRRAKPRPSVQKYGTRLHGFMILSVPLLRWLTLHIEDGTRATSMNSTLPRITPHVTVCHPSPAD